jgi:DNA-binding MarR family transcriptional regulator
MCSAVSIGQFDQAKTSSALAPEFSDSLGVLTSRVEGLAADLRTLARADASTPLSNLQLVDEARKIYRFRRKIDEIYDYDGFSRSPAWDIMLDLFEANAKGRSISVSSASIGAACPETTALRWLHALEQMGLISRSFDTCDKRRMLISMTRDGLQKTTDALRAKFEV